jgi:hypothetical protein
MLLVNYWERGVAARTGDYLNAVCIGVYSNIGDLDVFGAINHNAGTPLLRGVIREEEVSGYVDLLGGPPVPEILFPSVMEVPTLF